MVDTLKVGYVVPEILVPTWRVPYVGWATIACDQYTAQPEYWDEVKKQAGCNPSALQLIVPEAYLEDEHVDERIAGVQETMRQYLADGTFRQLAPGIVLTERVLPEGPRRGILLAMDLDCYDYDPEKRPMIRASEKTVLSRIPPRVHARKGAPLELPHVMLLIDDPQNRVIGPLWDRRESFENTYDFDLMLGGGHLRGWLITEGTLIDSVAGALESLPRHDNMLYCVGDGNHSLAAAKAIWDEAKKDMSELERLRSPLRYALCEVVNLHEKGVEFLPIHRLFLHVDAGKLLQEIQEECNKLGMQAVVRDHEDSIRFQDAYTIPFVSQDHNGEIVIRNPKEPLAVSEIQPVFDAVLAKNPRAKLDYIHGYDTIHELGRRDGCIGFVMPPVEKNGFFDLVVKCGVLPRKTFSIGEADHKRFYLEARRLV